jgi:hypothetical protein
MDQARLTEETRDLTELYNTMMSVPGITDTRRMILTEAYQATLAEQYELDNSYSEEIRSSKRTKFE